MLCLRTRTQRRMGLIALLFIFICTSYPRFSQAQSGEVSVSIASGIGTLFYTPLKLTVFVMAGVIGGLSLIGTAPAGNPEASIRIVNWGLHGDWFLLPEHFSGASKPEMIGQP